MSDFEPGVNDVDISLGLGNEFRVDPAAEFYSSDEKQALELAALHAKGDDKQKYFYICIFHGLDPTTQESWTEQRIEKMKELVGFDPRNVADWIALDEEIEALGQQIKDDPEFFRRLFGREEDD